MMFGKVPGSGPVWECHSYDILQAPCCSVPSVQSSGSENMDVRCRHKRPKRQRPMRSDLDVFCALCLHLPRRHPYYPLETNHPPIGFPPSITLIQLNYPEMAFIMGGGNLCRSSTIAGAWASGTRNCPGSRSLSPPERALRPRREGQSTLQSRHMMY